MKLLSNFKRVLILDSTVIELPRELAGVFKGYGGNASESALKIQFCYDLKSGNFFYFIQDGISADAKYENSFVDKIETDDLILKDMGYFNPQAFIELSNKGSYFLSRWKSNHDVFVKNETGNVCSLDIAAFLKKIDLITEIEIYIKKGSHTSKARLVVERVPEEVKNIRLRKLEKLSKKQGKQPKEMTKLFQTFNIYVSNISDNSLTKDNFRKLYGVRWQIELVFKNWKSNFNLDKFSGVKPARIKCMLYSRLLLIFISSKVIYQIRDICWVETRTEVSEFKASKHLIIVFTELLKLTIKKQENNIPMLLEQAIKFIDKHCKKLRQRSRTNNLDIISSIP